MSGYLVSASNLDEYNSLPIPHYVINLATQALGDSIARLSIMPEFFADCPHVTRVHIIVADYLMDFAQRMLSLYPVTIHKMGEQLPQYLNDAPAFTFYGETLTTLRLDLMQHAHLLLLQKQMPEHVKYIAVPPIDVAKPFVDYIVGTIDFTSPVRSMPVQTFLNIADECPLPIILLGNKSNIKDTNQPLIPAHPNIIDMRNKTTICEAQALISKARAIFGIDNGLLHLAGTTDTHIIMGFTSVAPEVRTPRRLNGKFTALVPPSDICRFCQSKSHLFWNHDYRNCAIVYTRCIKSLTADKWIKAIKEALNE